jgi:hypothetical protein
VCSSQSHRGNVTSLSPWLFFLISAISQIGLDEMKATTPVAPRSDLDSKLTEEMRRASEAAAWGVTPSTTVPPTLDSADALAPAASTPAPEALPPAPAAPAPSTPPQSGKLPDLSSFTQSE